MNTKIIHPFFPNVFFLYSLKISENQWFPDVFEGAQKGNIEKKWINYVQHFFWS